MIVFFCNNCCYILARFFEKYVVGYILALTIDHWVRGIWPNHFWIHPSKWSFWYQMKAPIPLITPVKCYVQQILKVTILLRFRLQLLESASLGPNNLTGAMRQIWAFFWYHNLYSNRHFKKTIGTKTIIYHVWVFGQIWCELCCLKLEPLNKISSNFGIRLF